MSLSGNKKSSALFSRFLSASIWSWLIYSHHYRLIEVYMFVDIKTVTKTTTRKKGGTGDKRDALELKTSGKRVRRMMGASAVRMREVWWEGLSFPAGFNWWWSLSRSRKWCRNSPYDLVKIKIRSRKRIHKLDGIGVGRIRTSLDFLATPLTTPSLTFLLLSSKTGENQIVGVGSRSGRITIATHVRTICDWFSSSASSCDTLDPVSLDRKRQSGKQNQNAVFTRS